MHAFHTRQLSSWLRELALPVSNFLARACRGSMPGKMLLAEGGPYDRKHFALGDGQSEIVVQH